MIGVRAWRQAIDFNRGADKGEIHAAFYGQRNGPHLHIEHSVGAGCLCLFPQALQGGSPALAMAQSPRPAVV